MNTEEIKFRIHELKAEINSLAARLPAYTHIEFYSLDMTKPSDIVERKRLYITITEYQPQIGLDLIERVRNRRCS